MIPNGLWNQNFLPLFVFGESPKPQTFSKFKFQKVLKGAILNIFWWDRAHLKDNTISHIRIERLVKISGVKYFLLIFSRKLRHFCVFGEFPGPLGQNPHKSLYTYVRNDHIFRLSLVSSKNIENCDLRNILNFQIFEKNFFEFRGIPENEKRREFFSEIVRKHLCGHFKPS